MTSVDYQLDSPTSHFEQPASDEPVTEATIIYHTAALSILQITYDAAWLAGGVYLRKGKTGRIFPYHSTLEYGDIEKSAHTMHNVSSRCGRRLPRAGRGALAVVHRDRVILTNFV
uniref:Uncharacterized protein n=1 Tax=Anopheles coluzzii TaxID=1518534 RepID=A0A8W7PEU2_ANOCL